MILPSPLWLYPLLLLSTATTTSVVTAETTVTGFDFVALETRLPKALSDFTAVADYDAKKVYISGGCDSVNGNQFNQLFGFVCDSISAGQYVFDLVTNEFSEETAMPVPRYRHAAALVNNQVWLVGGRDVEDNLVETVDVYDIASDAWTTYEDLDAKYQVSDLAGFAGPDGKAYFAAGYDFNYTAQSTVFAIDPIATGDLNDLVMAEVASLPTPRGDLTGVTATDQDGTPYALVTGGFTHENGFCDPLATSERYDFSSDTWTDAADLLTGRGDKALVVLNDRVFAIAGERQIANICLVDKPEPGDGTVPIDDVEWYNSGTDEWTAIEDLTNHRFRFAAIGYEDEIFTFGGQLAYDDSCKCFKTSDEVTVYREIFGMTSGAVEHSSKMVALLLAVGVALWL